jgi:hypothetical protein
VSITIRVDERLGSVNLPPPELVSHPKIRKAITEYRRAQNAEHKVASEWVHAERTLLAQASEKDADLMADALETGTADPGTPNGAEATEKIDELRRRTEASKIVTARRFQELRVVLDEHGDAWISDLADLHSDVIGAFHAALDQVMEAHANLVAVESLQRFTSRGRYWPVSGIVPFVGKPPEIGLDQALARLRAAAPVESVQLETADVA